MKEIVKILDKKFEIFIKSDKIDEAVKKVAEKMNEDLKNEDVIFLGILNGSFMFASDLYKQIHFDSQISFLKLASYEGTSSSGKVKRLIGINEDIKDKTVVIIEDIVDTGHTIETILKQLSGYEPKEIKIATFLFKPNAYKSDIKIDYIGIEIPNDFILGYGLDYDGYGRNLAHIYKIIE
ncbi:MAG: hypoxanthine phosphoribosyltransferase [Bacteroidales bacterium]|nr:hypoxanthine phosphoribosyltransferase [Bacteroidales bacterium]MBN2758769.1 hypoxanthine phosphoribosyltransferase [Bacteroidales bacterium]